MRTNFALTIDQFERRRRLSSVTDKLGRSVLQRSSSARMRVAATVTPRSIGAIEHLFRLRRGTNGRLAKG